MRYMVIANGAGEYNDDYHVVLVDAPTAEDAADWAADPKQGYGTYTDGILFVVPLDQVATFSKNPTTVVTITSAQAERVLNKTTPDSIPVYVPALKDVPQ